MTDVFISYTRDERLRCASVAERLRAVELDVWFDAKLASGTSFDREIEDKVRNARAVLVLWSPKSVQSNWVRSEATIGLQRDVLVSIEIAPCTLPIAFTNTHTEMLHRRDFSEDDPAWLNILARLSHLTGHPKLAAYRDRQPRPPKRRRGIGSVAALVAGAVALAGGATAGLTLLQGARPPAPAEIAVAAPDLSPEVTALAGLVVGQWAIDRKDCPQHPPGQPVDLTPSVGPWFTLQFVDGALRTTSAGNTVIESIVGSQNGWLRTRAAGEDLFYRLDDAGRLLLRVGEGEPTRLEPCI